LILGGIQAHAADSTQAGMITPAPVVDSMLLCWVGKWGGGAKFGDQAVYWEAMFEPVLDHQWIQGTFRTWTDKTKKTPVPVDFTMFVLQAATPGNYKAYGMSSDGTGSVATLTASDGVLNWAWKYDNDATEAGTLTRMGADHLVYVGIITGKDGKKLMDMRQDMVRMK
jgi:hypothetical protein